MRNPPKKKRKGRPATWQSAIVALRLQAESERWRLRVLHDVLDWEIFVTYWKLVQSQSVSLVSNRLVPEGLDDFTTRLAWCWDHVSMFTEASLQIISETASSISPAQVVDIFDVLQQGAIIFPDGSVQRQVIDRLDRIEARLDAQEIASINSSRRRAMEDHAAMLKLEEGVKRGAS